MISGCTSLHEGLNDTLRLLPDRREYDVALKERNTENFRQLPTLKNLLPRQQKENVSLQSPAFLCFGESNTSSACRFIRSAVEDALFCNARYRIPELSASYSVANATCRQENKKQPAQLFKLPILTGVLSVMLIVGLIFFYRQYQRLSRMRRKLSATCQELNDLNDKLISSNSNLQEYSLVKEEYIARFFDVCSAYVNRIETYRRILHKHARQGQMDKILKMIESDAVKEDVEELYRKFDAVFVSLYPTFVNDFNAMRPKSEKIVPKYGELMNTELRIFALIRSGINDSAKIASFLRYSLSAIYNYRVKARKCCNVDRKTFDKMIMKIGNTQVEYSIK
ncbi:MAG: DUF6377 domain-containing protein [Bacteroidales bacterium]|nr:DUF6377 domain-containing protein [Bacteroidales bacterium]